MKDRDKLTQFVSIVDEILKIEGNAWLIDELLLTIENHATYAQLRKHPLITRIHEYCVEEIIEKQAEEFYKDFPIEEIKEQLIFDFKEMEHQRNRDNFWKFSLHMFQQIEFVTNFLLYEHIRPNWNKVCNEKAEYHKNAQHNKRVIKLKDIKNIGRFPIGERIDISIYKAFRLSLHCFYFEEISTRNNTFIELETFNKINIARNKVHRYSTFDDDQKEILLSIESNFSMHYLLFYGFLKKYIYKIQVYYENRVQAITGSEMHQSQTPQKSNEISLSS